MGSNMGGLGTRGSIKREYVVQVMNSYDLEVEQRVALTSAKMKPRARKAGTVRV